MKTYLLFVLSFCFVLVKAQPQLQLELFTDSVPNNPIGLIHCNDDRVFAVCQSGYIMIIDTDGVINPTPYLDIDDRVESLLNAHGLLGAVFHPDYFTNGYLYVNYINNDMNTVISRFTVSADNPDMADPASEMIMLTVDQPYNVHKGGDMHFGPDGYLYFPLGDGGVIPPGGAGDPDNRAQNPTTYLGKMLRIDVNGILPYDIPADNPFIAAADTLHEIWSIGLRNPWRFSFDKLTGDMWLSDVGQDLWEEINFEPAGFAGGNNYGWRCYEANEIYNPDSCDGAVDFTYPIYVYPHNDSTGGYSITGGYVYRGSNFPGLYGKYIYCDYVTGNFYTLEPDGVGGWINTIYPALLYEAVSFGEDQHAEQYVVVRATSSIYKINDACAGFSASAETINADCTTGFTGSITLSATGGNSPYTFNWNTGDSIDVIDSLNPGIYTVTVIDSLGCSIVASYTITMTGSFDASYIVDGDSLIITPPTDATYVYLYNGDVIEDATTSIFEMNADGEYTMIVTNMFGCVDTLVYVYEKIPIAQNATKPTFMIAPNPTNHDLFITGLSSDNCYYEIYNSEGANRLTGNTNGQIDISSLPEGAYSIRLIQNGKLYTSGFMKMK